MANIFSMHEGLFHGQIKPLYGALAIHIPTMDTTFSRRRKPLRRLLTQQTSCKLSILHPMITIPFMSEMALLGFKADAICLILRPLWWGKQRH